MPPCTAYWHANSEKPHRGALAFKLIKNQISKPQLMPGSVRIASIMFPFPDNNPNCQSVSDLAALEGEAGVGLFYWNLMVFMKAAIHIRIVTKS